MNETSITKSPLENSVLQFCEKELKSHSFRVVDLDCVTQGQSLIRVFIENLEKRATSVDDCAKVSRILEHAIEAENVFKGSYHLEVSSPGLDRRLRLESDFRAFIGHIIKLKLLEKTSCLGLNITGQLVGVGTEDIRMDVNGKAYAIQYSQVKRASVVWSDENLRELNSSRR